MARRMKANPLALFPHHVEHDEVDGCTSPAAVPACEPVRRRMQANPAVGGVWHGIEHDEYPVCGTFDPPCEPVLPRPQSWTFGCRECSWEHTVKVKDEGTLRYVKHYAEQHRPTPIVTPNLSVDEWQAYLTAYLVEDAIAGEEQADG